MYLLKQLLPRSCPNEKDADVLIDQYKKYGISMWKIDGLQVTDKRGEINYRKFLDKVEVATNQVKFAYSNTIKCNFINLMFEKYIFLSVNMNNIFL